jgi:hypothetical protein
MKEPVMTDQDKAALSVARQVEEVLRQVGIEMAARKGNIDIHRVVQHFAGRDGNLGSPSYVAGMATACAVVLAGPGFEEACAEMRVAIADMAEDEPGEAQ